MTRLQFNVAMATGVLSIGLAVLIIVLSTMNRSLDQAIIEQQQLINRGGLSQQIGRNLLTDMGQAAVRNTKMRELLSRNGYTINPNNPSPEGANR